MPKEFNFIRKLLPFTRGIAVGVIVGLTIILVFWAKPFQQNAIVEIKHSPNNVSESILSYADAVENASNAVVNIHTTQTLRRSSHPFFDDPIIRRFFNRTPLPSQQRQTPLGSGVIVSAQGYIITNNHVIAGAHEITVSLKDGRSAIARIIGTDPDTDIAILHIPLNDLHSIVIGDSEQLRVGDVVLAIGNPFGVGQTVTQGIVSAMGRDQLGLSTFENFIQTDAAINPGNSGGALINSRGELIGINTAIFSRSGGSQGIGFAIPTSMAQYVLTQLIEKGQVTRSWLGIEAQPLTVALAESFGLSSTHGMVIAGVLRGGPADKAGLQPGDIIIQIDNKKISHSGDALKLISHIEPGVIISVHILRNGQALKLSARVGIRPARE